MDGKCKSDDVIAYYTRLETGIDILKSQEIWMTPRKNQRDPYEYALGSLKSIPRHSEMRENDTYISGSEAQDASSEIASFYRRVRQTSFCKTTIPKSFHPFLTDYYCFMKLRMWEQYGDLYQGCCLVFDRKKLAERNPQVYLRNVYCCIA